MMKVRWLIGLSAVVMISLFSAGNSYAVPVNYLISDDYITVGESFDVTITLDAAPDTYGALTTFGFDVINVSGLTYDGYVFGSNYDNGMMETSGTSSHVEGFLDFFADNTGEQIVLATLSFTAGEVVGLGSFGLLGSPLFYEGYIDEGISLSVTTSINAPVPEPATIFLLLTGMVGIAGVSRRRNLP